MLLVRADASTAIGTGHVMRCLALAQAWQDQGGQVAFVSAEMPPALALRLNDEQCRLLPVQATSGGEADAKDLIMLAKELQASWLLVDGYQFDSNYQRWLKEAGLRVVAIDDYGQCSDYTADIVLNQNLGADRRWYQNRSTGTELLLGPRYALLRREFICPNRKAKATSEVVRRVLITLGGSDPDNVSMRILDALEQIEEDLQIKLVIGGSNPHGESLAAAASVSRHWVELLRDVRDMPAVMQWADLAVCAGGSSNWEMCYYGLPRLAVILAENQKAIVQALHQHGALIGVGDGDQCSIAQLVSPIRDLVLNQSRREELSSNSINLVDGLGAQRAVSMLKKVSGFAR